MSETLLNQCMDLPICTEKSKKLLKKQIEKTADKPGEIWKEYQEKYLISSHGRCKVKKTNKLLKMDDQERYYLHNTWTPEQTIIDTFYGRINPVENEIWKEYDEKYMISNLGNCKNKQGRILKLDKKE